MHIVKTRFVVAPVIALLLAVSCLAQKDAGVRFLLNKYGGFNLPVPASWITQKLKTSPSISKDELAGIDVYTWTLKSGLKIVSMVENTKAKANTKDIYFHGDSSKTVLSGLPLGLTLYGSTLKQCLAKFKRYKPVKTELWDDTEFWTGDKTTTPPNGYRLSFRDKGGLYYHLYFDEQLLKSITIATYTMSHEGD